MFPARLYSVAFSLIPILSFIFLHGQVAAQNGAGFTVNNKQEDNRFEALASMAEQLAETEPDSALYYLDLAGGFVGKDEKKEIRLIKLKADAFYYKYDFQEAVSWYLKAAAKEKEVNGEFSIGFAERLGDAGFCYSRMIDYPNAVEYYKKALAIVRVLDNKGEIATNLNNIGIIFNSWGNYDSAIHYHSAALEIDKTIGDHYFISVDYNNIGKIYQAWGKLDRALEYYNESLLYADSSGRENSVAIRLNNIGMIYKQKEDFEKALAYIEKALAIDVRLNNRYRMGVRYHNLGQIYDATGKQEVADEYYLRALELFREVGNIEATALVYRSIGELHFNQGMYTEAESYYRKSLSIADSIKLQPLIMDNHLMLSVLYEKMGAYAMSLDHYKEYAARKDSLFSENEQKLITEFQTKYETGKKEQEIQLLNKAQEINSLKLRKVNVQRYALIITSVLLIVIILLVVYKNRYKHRMNSLLEEKNVKLEVLNATKDKFFTILSHDLRNPMTGIKNLSRSLSDNIFSIKKEDAKQMADSLNDSSNRVYELTQNLLQWARTQNGGYPSDPGPLSISDLVDKNLKLHKARADNKNIILESSELTEEMVFADEQMVNTVLRNLISNAIKFTDAGGKIRAHTRKQGDFLHVSISDTGIGMTEEDVKKLFRIDQDVKTIGQSEEKGSGLGLIICQEFITQNKGHIVVESNPGEGSTFTFTLPLANTPSAVKR